MHGKGNLFIITTLSVSILFFGCDTEVRSSFLTKEEAINEIGQLVKLLNAKSPYMNINNDRVLACVDSLVLKLHEIDEIQKNEFSFILKRIFAELGDRHFGVVYKDKSNWKNKYYLPFALAPWKDDKVIALVKKSKRTFFLYLEDFPFLTHINGQSVEEFINQYDPDNKYAPKYSKQALSVAKLNEFYKIKRGLNVGDQMRLTFTNWNFKSDTTLFLNLVDWESRWHDDDHISFDENNEKMEEFLFKHYENHIAYIRIPQMYSYLGDKECFSRLKQIMDTVRRTNALIIDIRSNRGGNRDLIDFFSNYLVPPEKFIVANLARYRGKVSNHTKRNLYSRRLFPYSHFKDSESKQAIGDFMEDFHPPVKISETLYSEYHYMVMNSKRTSGSYYYRKPVYILTNEMTFSAASVFASSFKGLENVRVAGVSADGSSGMSKTYEFKNSEIQVRLSHMLSYQKSGELFDGVGVAPDIEIHRSISQIFGYEDHQLMALLKKINGRFSSENYMPEIEYMN